MGGRGSRAGPPRCDDRSLRACAGPEVVDALAVAGMAVLLAAGTADLFLAAVAEGVHLDAGLTAGELGRERREATDPLPGSGLLEDRTVLVEADDRVVHARPFRLVRVEAMVRVRGCCGRQRDRDAQERHADLTPQFSSLRVVDGGHSLRHGPRDADSPARARQ